VKYTEEFGNKMRADVEFNKFMDDHRHLNHQDGRHEKYELWLGCQSKIDALAAEKAVEAAALKAEIDALKLTVKDLLAPFHEGCPTTARLTNAATATYARWAQGEIARLRNWIAEALVCNDFAAKALSDTCNTIRATPFQDRVHPWLLACFGEKIASDPVERNHRFVEEALELAQACDCTSSEAHQLVDYVFNRPIGEKPQEVGGVMVTLAALCLAQNMDMHDAGEVELARIWTKVEVIRAKQAAKPKHGPLPMHVNADTEQQISHQ